ncbi:MAG: 23S rRNA (uracil(1939)-C(5))-methyltransferase RlmD [Elusimicrobia bacterium]|nr:23S rRNA (uracil(1939)-C(5))-methyltransferase RlmD [Elusimicrobiota bacterium]
MKYKNNKMIKCGKQIELTIEKIITGGDGLGRYGKLVVMVPYSVPQDKLLVEITETKKHFAYARVVSVISPSPYRIVPPCPAHYSLLTARCLFCGGCNFQMIEYKKQLEYKSEVVQDFFDIKVNKMIPADNQFEYRNKIQMPIGGSAGKINMGFFHPGSHKIVNVNRCFLQTKKTNDIISEIRRLVNEYNIQPYNEDKGTGILRHIILRKSSAFDEFMLIIVSKTNFIPRIKEITSKISGKFPEIVSIYQNINPKKTNVILGDKNFKIYGRDTIKEKIGNTIFAVSPISFFQINTEQTLKLYNTIKDFAKLSGSESVFDIYSGVGSISLYLSPYCRKITGIEEIPSAVSDAFKNCKFNNIKNAFFIRGNAEQVLKRLEFPRNSVVILDPPRAGCSREVLTFLLKSMPLRIVYTSCNPATLSRDVKLLSDKYKLLEIQPVDMFPQTAHIECVAKLEPKC